MNLEELRNQIPEPARDIKLNLQSVLAQSVLSPAQTWGVAVAAAVATRNPALRAAIVSEARKVPADQLRNTVADGRVVTGREALAATLVDQIGYIEDAYTLARDLGKAADAPVVRYHRESGFLETLLEAAKPGNAPRASTRLELSVGGTPMMPRLQPGVPYYLSTSYAR